MVSANHGVRSRVKGAIVVAAGLVVVRTAGAGTASQPVGRYLFPSRGLVTQFERRGAPNGYVWGEPIQQFHAFDPVVGTTVEAN